jgi:hypothetical protein
VVGAGAALVALGGGFELAARDNVLAYEREVGRACPSGCTDDMLPQAVRDLASRASWQDAVGVTAIGVGVATVAVGGLLVAWNQPRRVRVDESGRRVSIRPVVGADGAGVVGRLSF